MGDFKRAHEDLDAWKLGMDVVDAVYKLTAFFPREELFTLTSQMRRAAISIPTNIAEGAAKESWKDSLRFYIIARGSLSELETELKIAERQRYISDTNELDKLLQRESKVLSGLINSIRRKLKISERK